MFFVVYDPASGEILRSGFSPEPELQGEHVLVTEDLISDDENYVVEGVITLRPTLPDFDRYTLIADGVDFVSVPGLPVGTQVEILNVGTYTVDDGTFEFCATVADTYVVRVTAWPYLSAEYTLIAEAPV